MEKKNLRNLLLSVSAVAGFFCASQSAYSVTYTYCCQKDGSSIKARYYAAKLGHNIEELTEAVCGEDGLVGTCEKVKGTSCKVSLLQDKTHTYANNSVNSALSKIDDLDKLCSPAAVNAANADETPAEEKDVAADEAAS